MNNDQNDFVEAFLAFIKEIIKTDEEALEYSNRAIKVIDARNHLFKVLEKAATDEEQDIYALRELCRMEEEQLEMVPDVGRLKSIARNYFY